MGGAMNTKGIVGNSILSGQLDRRKFLAGTGALAMAGLLPARAMAQASQPKRGGRLVIGLAGGSTTDSMDPQNWAETFMQSVGHAVYSYMTEIDNEGQLKGELAESWESSPDAKIWTFRLRDGVTFHNGKTLDAEDVLQSINYHRAENSKSAAKGIVNPIVDLKTDGKRTIVFTLDGGNADFPYVLEDYHLAIMPAKNGSVDTSGIGTGPFRLKEFSPGIRAIVERNQDNWKEGAGWLDTVEFLSLKDVTARTNALVTGEIDAMDRCDLKTISMLERAPGIEVASIPSMQHYTMDMMVDVDPFTNVDVRLALKYAVDRQQMVDTILYGHGTVGNDSPISALDRFYNKELEQRAYDPEKARFHLKKAGLSTVTVNLSSAEAAFPGALDAAALYSQQAAKAGITVNIIRESDDGYWDNVWRRKPMCMVYWSGRPTTDATFSLAYAAEAAWNDTHWKNPRFNEILVMARSELDNAKRAELYAEAQLLCRDDGGTILPMFANNVFAVSSKVGHGKFGANWDLDGTRAAERWWNTEA